MGTLNKKNNNLIKNLLIFIDYSHRGVGHFCNFEYCIKYNISTLVHMISTVVAI